MRTFNVSEIATMLGVNEETVRRWIRSGKLKSTQHSKKQGNVVNEGDLLEFVASNQKFFRMLNTTGFNITEVYSIGLRELLRNLINERDKLNDQISKIQALLEEL